MATADRDRLLARRRRLRRTPGAGEARLWERLRNRQCAGAKFRRQETVAGLTVDFLCPEARLVVEVDGGVHDRPDIAAADSERDRRLRAAGYRVMRIHSRAVMEDTALVLVLIARAVNGEDEY